MAKTEKYDYDQIVVDELKKLRTEKFTGRAAFVFHLNDGGIGNLSLQIDKNLLKGKKFLTSRSQ